jgi:hypothetical protein
MFNLIRNVKFLEDVVTTTIRKNMKTNFYILALMLTLASCASSEHVRAGADGINHVVIRGTDKTAVEQKAIREAKCFCDDRKLSPAFVKEEIKYTGSMDESTHKTIQHVSRAAAIGGGMMGVMGGTTEKNVGKGIFGAGTVGSAFEDKEAYTADMKFKCM